MRKRIYISLPVTGHDLRERRKLAAGVARALEALGAEAVNPLENGLPEGAAWLEHMRADLRLLLDCDGILLCDGWEESRGCRVERGLAAGLGLLVFPPDMPFDEAARELARGRREGGRP